MRPAVTGGHREAPKRIEFVIDRLTFIFLQTLSFIINAMTLAMGIVLLFLGLKSIAALAKLLDGGNNPIDLEIRQHKTKKHEIYIIILSVL